MKLVVGLGNPGSQYEGTRHNIGFEVVDALVGSLHTSSISKTSFYGQLYKSSRGFFLKPHTFMNLSGKSVLAVKSFYKIATEDIIVIHDDIDLPFGAVRFKRGGGHGGHNGLKSIDAVIGKDYVRVRIGVGKPLEKSQVASYVLSSFDEEERRCLPQIVDYAAKATAALLSEPLDEVKTRFSVKSAKVLCP